MDYSALAAELLSFRTALHHLPAVRGLDEMSGGEYFVLHFLLRHGGTAGPSELSRSLYASSARIAALLKHLEAKGWIVRTPDAADVRRVDVVLTEPGGGGGICPTAAQAAREGRNRLKRPIDWREDRSAVREKVAESAHCVLPIVLIVVLLCLAAAPMKPDLLLSFLIGGVMLVVGMGLFSLGAEQSMTPIGTKIGTALTRTKNLPLILGVSFALGFAITVAEPDLQVLAETVPHISSTVLLLTVGVGVGLFMAVCMLRIVTGANLRWLLIGCYALIFLLAAFSDPDFLGIAFDSGGVTTGPMTVPFILAMGLGVSNIRSDRRAEADSFGLVALCSVGPILAVLILGFFYQGSNAVADLSSASFGSSTAIGGAFLASIPLYLKEMAISMLPIVAIFFLFQLTLLRLPGRSLAKILIGILYTYVGLVLFLTGVNVGFSPLGAELGAELAVHGWLLVPLAMVLGWFIISAEPADGVLEKQIESVSAGAIPGKVIQRSLSVAIALAMGLSMLRVLTGISILWFLVPGYGIALALSFFVPDIYTAIAFDSGGVATGPMTAPFMLQFVMGASSALGGNILRDAFGVVALVAMMPLLSIQAVGFLYERRAKRTAAAPEQYGDFDIVELWEDAA